MNQGHLAEHLSINQSAWSKIERGISPPTVEQLAQVAALFRTTPGRLLSEADQVAQCLQDRGVKVSPHRIEAQNALNAGWLVIGAAALAGLVAAALASLDESE